MSVAEANIAHLFEQRFGCPPDAIGMAPGRVNLIGEHTDYNGGYVLPIAIDRNTAASGRRSDESRLHVIAHDFDAETVIDLSTLDEERPNGWAGYIAGLAWMLKRLGATVSGADMLIHGDVPLGSGLSSSASLEMAVLDLFEQLNGITLPGAEAAQLGQAVENEYLELSSGIMDQFVSRCARAGHALFLDCRDLRFSHVPIAFEDAAFVICNTGVSRGLTSSAYNQRVSQCASAVRQLNALVHPGDQLRDFTLEDMAAVEDQLDELSFRRARHVISENDRTLKACEALRSSDTGAFGALMDESDTSLRVDFEVTSPELDAMTAAARAHGACIGARMTGAGFGGCCISLVRKTGLNDFIAYLSREYRTITGIDGAIFPTMASAGSKPAL